MTDKPRILLVDLSSLFWSAWRVNAENGMQAARTATLDGVRRAMGEGHDTVAICCDSGRSFRRDIYDGYKAQREKQEEAAYGELDRTKERLAADGFLLWSAPGFEADDILATATKIARDRGHEVRIVSADKDLLQLLGPGVDVLRSHTWQVVTERDLLEKFKVEAKQFGDFLALKGDTSDNIPGCKGCGDVSAADLLTRYESLDGIYAALEKNDVGVAKPALRKNLIDCKAAVELSRKLVALRYDVPINFDDLFAERKVTPLTTSEPLPSDGDPTDGPEPTQIPGPEPKSEATAPSASDTDAPFIPASRGVATGTTGESVALVPVVEYERQLEPRSLRAAVWLGQHLHSSRLYEKFKTPEAVTAVIIRGREMGLGASTSLDVFHVIEGRPSPYAYLIIARAKAHPDCEYLYCAEADEKHARWVTKNRRNPVETSVTYTIEQAKTAGLMKPNSAWFKHPEDQVVKSAGVKLARREYPDAALGLYAVIEMGGDEE